MPIFVYNAKEPNGKLVTGEMDAPDERVVAQTLREHQLFILKISQKKKHSFSGSMSFFNKVGADDLLNFTRQLSIMMTSGLSITQSLTILQAQNEHKAFGTILETIAKDVQSGQSLAATFEKYPKVFTPTYIALIRAGEAAGLLEQILPRLADTLEKQKEFRSKTNGAFIYPIIVLVGMIAVMLIMLIFVIPKLTSLYSSLGTQLPLPTLILITLSNFILQFWWLLLILSVGGGFVFLKWQKTSAGQEVLDLVFFRLPIFGTIRKTNILTELTRTLGLLTSSGVPIIEALKIVAQTTGSKHYEYEMTQSAVGVEKGLTLAQSFTNPQFFPKIVTYMIQTGEETGKLGDVLLKLAHFFEIEAEHKVKNLSVAMEPVIMIVLGIGVGFLILSIILPIYKLTSSF